MPSGRLRLLELSALELTAYPFHRLGDPLCAGKAASHLWTHCRRSTLPPTDDQMMSCYHPSTQGPPRPTQMHSGMCTAGYVLPS